MGTSKNKIEIILSAVDTGLSSVFGKVNKAISAAEQGSRSYGKSMTALQTPIRALSSTLAQLGAAFGAVFATKQFIQTAESYAGIDARLKLVTSSADEFNQVQNDLYDMSQKTGTGYAENAATYTSLAVALKSSGASAKELVGINEAVAKTLVIGGSSAAEASSFLLQFGQAMGSGVLQGDEFRAMMESNSYFAQQLATALDTDVAGLRAMSKEGLLTSGLIREAVPKMLQQINTDFAKMPLTIGRAITMLSNAFGKLVNGSNQAGGATGKIAEVIKSFVGYLESNGKAIENFAVNFVNMTGDIVKGAWEYKNFIVGFAATAIAVSAVASLTTAIKGISAAVFIIGGANVLFLAVVAASIYAAVSIGKLINQYLEWRDATKELAAAQADAKAQSDWINPKIASKLKEINAALHTNFTSMNELFAAEKRGEVHFDQMTATWVKGAAQQSAAVATSASVQERVTGAALDAMQKKYQEYAAEVHRLQTEISGRMQSLTAELRDMSRSGMSGLDAWKDQKKEAEEYTAAAKKAAEEAKIALEAGDTTTAGEKYKEAIGFADEAKEAYKNLNTEVKDGDQVMVSKAEALKTAMEGVKVAGQLGIEILKEQQNTAVSAMNALTEKSGFQDLSKGMDEAEQKWLKNWQDMQAEAVKAIAVVEDRLLQIKDKEVTVWINEKVKKQQGGPVQRFARGGKLSGYGGGDKIQALLEAGEFIIRKEAVAKFGGGFFAALNALRIPSMPRFAIGGPVAAAAISPAGSSPTSSTAPINITLNYSGSSQNNQTSAREMTKMVLAEMKRQYRVLSK